MARREGLVVGLALLCSLAAFAGGAVLGNPTNLHPVRLGDGLRAVSGLGVHPGIGIKVPPRPRPLTRPRPAISLSAPIAAIRGIALDGSALDVDIAPDLDLSDPLPVPPGAVDLEIELAGPLTMTLPVTTGERIARELEPATLVVSLDDPDADEVVLDLPPELVEPLCRATDGQAEALLESLVAEPW